MPKSPATSSTATVPVLEHETFFGWSSAHLPSTHQELARSPPASCSQWHIIYSKKKNTLKTHIMRHNLKKKTTKLSSITDIRIKTSDKLLWTHTSFLQVALHKKMPQMWPTTNALLPKSNTAHDLKRARLTILAYLVTQLQIKMSHRDMDKYQIAFLQKVNKSE